MLPRIVHGPLNANRIEGYLNLPPQKYYSLFYFESNTVFQTFSLAREPTSIRINRFSTMTIVIFTAAKSSNPSYLVGLVFRNEIRKTRETGPKRRPSRKAEKRLVIFFSKLAPIRFNHDRLDTGKRERVRLVYHVYRSLVFSFGFSLVN